MYQPIVSLDLPPLTSDITRELKKLGLLYVEDVEDPAITDSEEWKACTTVPPMQSAMDLYLKDQRHRISTTLPDLDGLMNGGFQKSQISELCGDTGCGKTQLSFRISVHHLIKTSEECEVLFISTNNNFAPQRIREVIMSSDALETLTSEEKENFCRSILQRLHVIDVCDITELLATVKHLEHWIKNRKVCLLIIDSIFMPFKSVEFVDRRRLMYRLINDLQVLAEVHNFAIIFTNNLTTKVLDSTSTDVAVCLGDNYYHRINLRIMLSRTAMYTFKATIVKSVSCPETSVEFVIK